MSIMVVEEARDRHVVDDRSRVRSGNTRSEGGRVAASPIWGVIPTYRYDQQTDYTHSDNKSAIALPTGGQFRNTSTYDTILSAT
jgi:hypothetical protein